MARKGARIRGHFTSNANIENQCVGLGDGYSKTQARAIRGVPPAGYGVAKLGIEYRAGHPAKIRAAETCKQKHDRRDSGGG